jgi:hypothetical protein
LTGVGPERVDKPDPQPDAGEENEAEETAAGLVVARRHPADLVAVVCAVAEQNTQVAVPLLHQSGVGSGVVSFTGRQHNRNREAEGVGPEVDLCRGAATRAPQTLAHGPAPRSGGAVVRPHEGAVDHPQQVCVAAAAGQRLQ